MALFGAAPTCGLPCLAREGRVRRCRMSLASEGALRTARPTRRGLRVGVRGALRRVTLRLLSRPLRCAPLRRLKPHARASCLREADRNRLLRRLRAVFSLTNVMDFFAYELAGLGRQRLSFLCIPLRSLDRLLLGHGTPTFPLALGEQQSNGDAVGRAPKKRGRACSSLRCPSSGRDQDETSAEAVAQASSVASVQRTAA